MTDSHQLARRILALPGAEQRRAVLLFQRLVEERRAELGPTLISPVEIALSVGLEPDPWQIEVLKTDEPRLLLNCARQTGKSTIAALLAVHTALYKPASLVLLLSPSLRQSGELFRKVRDSHAALTDPVAIAAESALRLELTNGSRIVSLPGKEHTVRGFSGVSLLIVDEAARVPDELYYSVRPMLAVSDGRLITLSTPFGTRGWWYEAWKSEEPWERYEVQASECPRIPAEFLDEEQRTLGEWWYAQEYECKFLDAETQSFRREDIDRMFDEDVEEWVL